MEDAIRVMEEANTILEDIPTEKMVIYASLYLIEIALCFWVALKLV